MPFMGEFKDAAIKYVDNIDDLIDIFYEVSNKNTVNIYARCPERLYKTFSEARSKFYSLYREKIKIIIGIIATNDQSFIHVVPFVTTVDFDKLNSEGISKSDIKLYMDKFPNKYWKNECKYCTHAVGCVYKEYLITFKDIILKAEKDFSENNPVCGTLTYTCNYFELDKDIYLKYHPEENPFNDEIK